MFIIFIASYDNCNFFDMDDEDDGGLKRQLEGARARLLALQRHHKELYMEDAHALTTHMRLTAEHARANTSMLEAKAAYETMSVEVRRLEGLLKDASEIVQTKQQVAQEARARMEERKREVERLETAIDNNNNKVKVNQVGQVPKSLASPAM